jgi:3-deoxy-D-manno-octulosonic-acid transferase
LIILYNCFLFIYSLGIRIASAWSSKARLWLRGRLEQKELIKNLNITDPTVWMHCASLGEFEQGRPLLEKIKATYPRYKIILTFFSPSGYEIRKNYTGADQVLYLPKDGRYNAQKFIENIKPSLVIWVKYEYWYYYLTTLHQKNIPVILISAIFRDSQPFFKWYGGTWRKMLSSFHKIFVQNDLSLQLLNKHHFSEVIKGGDTRFDRVIEIAEKNEPLPQLLTDFCNGKKVLVAGSTWPEDEKVLLHYTKANPEIKFIIAPHEIHKENILAIQKYFKDVVLYSELTSASTEHVLIIDNIGMLSRLYRLADVTYVGGGFGNDGIHNVLEAAVYGKPVVFGPVYEKFAEAKELVGNEGGFPVNNAIEMEHLLNKLFLDRSFLKISGDNAARYVYSKQGATAKIMDYVAENRLLTN